ncbi:ferrous iron transporter B [Pseudomonas monteilii SB3101]|uniref:Ferrous iron transporter B n=2 Tax=Pseudomonas TaxID=286 RepID=V9UW39_9PSED|nr:MULTISPECIES: fimbria/pilus outer membrane usher protein [Pseudomonas]AHC81467.1 ferrous iron transporter B [Pseudomonas monteilii SB3078]AHC86896.1 ferrous iron transporter B [Pseudomonas monteilii SB3101]MEE1919003.1 fimbria/pilus outer membrane usher protein [Pseudomonas asiatica]
MPPLPQRSRMPSRLRLAPLLALGGTSLLLCAYRPVQASPPSPVFNASFMRQAPGESADAAQLALQSLAASAALAPGRYRVSITLNLALLGEHELDFLPSLDQQGLQACLSADLLREFGLREEALEQPLDDSLPCQDLVKLLPDARAELDPGKLQLAVSIPQFALRRDIAGAVPAERWDAGINAAFLNYQVATQALNRRDGSQANHDLLLNSGVNLGSWRLRSSQALRDDGQGERSWTRSNTYVQRDLPDNRGNFTLGETFSHGEVFRSLPFKGMQVASDMGMLPDVMQSYAPVIRGVAQTRAKLEVLLNGYPIYTTFVAPGPYVIDDLGVGGGSGELEVVLTEADGQVRRFLQPYSSLTNLLRQGVWRYSATLGRYNGAEHLDNPLLWQATLARGGSWSTLYGGVQGGDYYRAALLGMARDLGHLGAVSLDVTQASADLGQRLGQVQGQSYSARYGKAFTTGTNLRFAGYRYSSEGYRDYDEAVRERNAYSGYLGNRRSRLEASVYQSLGNYGSLSLSLSQDDYWRNNLQRRQYQLQYNTQYRNINFNLFASQSLTRNNHQDRLIGLNITLPLDWFNGASATIGTQASNGRQSQRASLSGGALDNRLRYTASTTRDIQQQTSGALSVGYQGAWANVGAGYTQGNDYQSFSANASGAMVLHAGGLTIGSQLGETNALVEVPGTPGLGVQSTPGGRTDSAGYLIAPHLRPYRSNPLHLDTADLAPQVQIDNGSTQVVPRRGAIVKATFAARNVSRLILTLLQANGKPLPFGAQVSDEQGQVLAVVGQAGQALVATDDKPQPLHVQWGGQTCQLAIAPRSMREEQGYRLQTLQCPQSSTDSPRT